MIYFQANINIRVDQTYHKRSDQRHIWYYLTHKSIRDLKTKLKKCTSYSFSPKLYFTWKSIRSNVKKTLLMEWDWSIATLCWETFFRTEFLTLENMQLNYFATQIIYRHVTQFYLHQIGLKKQKTHRRVPLDSMF